MTPGQGLRSGAIRPLFFPAFPRKREPRFLCFPRTTSLGSRLRGNDGRDGGITAATDIEVLSGVKPGDEIVIGTYQVLRTIKSGAPVKRDTSVAAKQSSETA